MGKSTDRNINTEEEFFKLEQVLNQTADDTVNCLKLLKEHLSEYDSRNGNHFIHTASSYMRSDIRTAKDTAMDLKHVAHQLNKNHKPSKTEISSARNMRDATAKAMETLKATAHNYDRENGQRMGVKGTIDAAVGGHDDKEKEEHGLFGKDEKESEGGLFGKNKSEDEKQSGLFGKSDKEENKHHGGFLGGDDYNGGGFMGSTETVETLVKKILRDNFSLSALDQQITATEKSLSPSIVERAKEKMHDVKDKLKGDKSSDSAHEQHNEGHHHKVLP